MGRNVTITFADGTTHVYQNVPDNATPDQVTARAQTDFAGKEITALDGGKKSAQVPVKPADNSRLGGLALGAVKPLDNLTTAAMSIPGMGALDRLGQRMGLPSAHQAVQGNQAAQQNNTRTGYQTLGNIAGTLPTMALPGGAAVQGATSGALLSDASTPGGVLADAGISALGSKAMGMAANGLGYIAKPVVSKGAQLLHDSGIDLTLGQLAHGGKSLGSRIVAGMEDRVAGLPIVGDLVNVARGRGLDQLNQHMANDALSTIGEKLPAKVEAGHDLLDFVGDRLSQRYQNVVPKLVGHVDQQFGTDLAAANSLTRTLPNARQTQFKNIIMSVFENRADPSGKVISGQALKDAETSLTDEIRRYSKPTATGDESKLADALVAARQALRDMAARSDPSGTELQGINKGWAKLQQMRAASGADGVMSPTAMARQANKSGFGTDLARAAQQLLPNKIPDSGTAGRNAMGTLLGDLAGGGALAHFVSPAAAIPAAGALLYTKPGMQALNSLVFRKYGISPMTAQAFKRLGKAAPAVVPPLLRSLR